MHKLILFEQQSLKKQFSNSNFKFDSKKLTTDPKNSSTTANESVKNQQESSNESFFSHYFKTIKSFPAKVSKTIQAKLDEAKENSDSDSDYWINITNWFSSTLIWSICLAITVILPVILAIAGLLNIDDCKSRPCKLTNII